LPWSSDAQAIGSQFKSGYRQIKFSKFLRQVFYRLVIFQGDKITKLMAVNKTIQFLQQLGRSIAIKRLSSNRWTLAGQPRL
jgi:hypothetical protein